MSNATHKCLWLLLVLVLSVTTVIASPSSAIPVAQKVSKEIIIVNYAQCSAEAITSITSYAHTTYIGLDNAKIVIKDYSASENKDHEATLEAIVVALNAVGISSDNISVEKESPKGTSGYFSLTISAALDVQ